MVKKGEYLERPALIDAGGVWLEGLYHRGEDRPGLLVCPPVAGEIGMDAPAVAELGFASARAGRASLRFQHRGFGASQGHPDATRAVDDARAALSHLEACLETPRADVAGYRTGVVTAMALARSVRRLRSVVLIAPHDVVELDGLEHQRVLVVLPGVGETNTDAWRARVDALGDAKLVVIDGADHRFVRGLTRVGEVVMEWLEGATDLKAETEDAPPEVEASDGRDHVDGDDDAMIIVR